MVRIDRHGGHIGVPKTPVEVELFSNLNALFCSNNFVQMLAAESITVVSIFR